MTPARKPYIPRPYGLPALQFLLENKRANLWADPGLGKTSITYLLLESLRLIEGARPKVLAIGTKRIAETVWPIEPLKWDFTSDWSTSVVQGTPETRMRRLLDNADVFTTNYELLPWLVEHFKERWPFSIVIADEATRLKSFTHAPGRRAKVETYEVKTGRTSVRAKALATVAHRHVDRWVNLTGTPVANGYQDLWGQMWFVDMGARLGYSKTAYTNRWFRRGYNGFGVEILPHSKREIDALIADVSLSIRAADWLPLDQPVQSDVCVELPPSARKAYDDMERHLVAELRSGETIVAKGAATGDLKCMQIANGFVYDENGAAKWLHGAKIDALDELLEELGGACGSPLVAYQFQEERRQILAKVRGGVDISTSEGLRAYKRGGARYGLGHPASVSLGVDGLQDVTNALIRFGHNWSLEERIQMLDRIGSVRQYQTNSGKVPMVYNLVAKDTIDETISARHETKRATLDLLMERFNLTKRGEVP